MPQVGNLPARGERLHSGEPGSNETQDEQLESAQRPEGHLGLQRPAGAKAATQKLFVFGMVFRHRGELQTAPAAAVDFHIVVAPTNIRFVGPAALVQLPQNPLRPGQPIDLTFAPILDFLEGLLANFDLPFRKLTIVYYFRILATRWLGLDVRAWMIRPLM